MDNYIKTLLPKLDEHSTITIHLGKRSDGQILDTNISEKDIQTILSYLTNIACSPVIIEKHIYNDTSKYILDGKVSKSFLIDTQCATTFHLGNIHCLVKYENLIPKPFTYVPKDSFYEYIVQKKIYTLDNTFQVHIQSTLDDTQSRSHAIYMIITRQALHIQTIFNHINRIISIFNQLK
jgi:hypothetical protein